MEVIRTLTDVSRRERQRAAWGISCLSKVSRKARVPFKGAIPGAPLGGGQPFSPLACTSRKSYTQKHAPLLICAFEVWVHPQHVSQRHIKQVATPADQVRPPLRERSKLGNQSQFMQGNLCLPFLQLISKEIPFFFKTFWRLKKKKTKNQHNSRQSTYVIISAFTRALQCVSDYGWKFVLFSLSCNLCLLLTTSLNTWQKAENLPFLTDQVLASTNETIMDLHISFKGVNIWTGIIKTKKSILFLKCVSDFHGGQLDNFLLLLN